MEVTRRNFVKAAFGASAAIVSGAALASCTSGTPAQTKETEAAASTGYGTRLSQTPLTKRTASQATIATFA